ncbi:hypothetical protein BD410DRAFT_288109 [Rickenella mellea]|uniref:Uncharacterized protein n=1 Tax=Rickenella mellea TaxID=50990 RepID=A0A4Y7Q361_9AGAM|nr:hypothetical protein BD410DRAFT_288109 [Rickenella mellea]
MRLNVWRSQHAAYTDSVGQAIPLLDRQILEGDHRIDVSYMQLTPSQSYLLEWIHRTTLPYVGLSCRHAQWDGMSPWDPEIPVQQPDHRVDADSYEHYADAAYLKPGMSSSMIRDMGRRIFMQRQLGRQSGNDV